MTIAAESSEPVQQLALRPPPPVPLVPVPPHLAAPAGLIFGGMSRLRGRRAMHPVGVVMQAALAVADDPALPQSWRALDGVDGVVRFSKSIGLPGRIPDVLGIALRFGGQDLLLASAAAASPGLHHVVVPTAGFDGTVFSSLLPHRVGTRAAVIQARIARTLPAAGTYLEAVAQAGPITLELGAVGLFGGTTRLGTVAIGEVIAGETAARLRFDPWRAGGSLRPVGPFQRIRAAAYAASRAATRV